MNNNRILIVIILILNLIAIGAVSASGSYYGSTAAVSDDTPKSSGVSYAILAGVSTYKNPSSNLDGVQYDTPHMRDMLINDCGYSSSRITSLQDGQATKSAIRQALIQMSSRAGKDDTVVFYFSGHGYVYPSGYGTSYLEPYDSELDSVYYDISSSELKQWLDGIRCKNILVIIDACEAEGMLKGGAKEMVTTSQLKAGSDKTPGADRFSQNFLGTFESRDTLAQSSAEQQKALNGNQYLVLVSCRSGEGSWTNTLSGSWFTTYFVEGVGNPSADTNSDTWVSAEEAFNYASPLTTWKHYDQHPVIYDGDQSHDLLMARYGSSTSGTIDVTSSPAGATVYLDGKNSGYNTPATLPGISAGSHTVRCSMTGYTDASEDVTVTAGQTTSLMVTLQSQGPLTGTISVSSTPTGARIYLDGTDTGYNTPRTFSGVPVGSYTVRCSMTGYTDVSQGVTVTAGRTSSVKVYLTRQGPVTGSISVSSVPAGASVWLDGKITGYKTPVTLNGISAGSHTVRCSMTGYTDASQGVSVIAGQTASLMVTLQDEGPLTGTISVSSTPTGARIYLDGTDTGYSTPRTFSGVPVGTHTVRCSMAGYTDASQSVTVNAGRTSSVKVSLTRQGPVTGSISVSSVPAGAGVYLDGNDTGFTTPVTISTISTGTHTVRCSMAGYTDQSQSVTVTAGQTTDVVLNLRVSGAETGSIYVTSLPSRALIYLDGKYLGVYTPTTINKVTAGTHTLRLTKYGYKDYTRSIIVVAGTTSPVSVVLTR